MPGGGRRSARPPRRIRRCGDDQEHQGQGLHADRATEDGGLAKPQACAVTGRTLAIPHPAGLEGGRRRWRSLARGLQRKLTGGGDTPIASGGRGRWHLAAAGSFRDSWTSLLIGRAPDLAPRWRRADVLDAADGDGERCGCGVGVASRAGAEKVMRRVPPTVLHSAYRLRRLAAASTPAAAQRRRRQ